MSEQNKQEIPSFDSVEELVEAYTALKRENEELKNSVVQIEEENKPSIYETEEWENKIKTFMEEYPEARKYTSEIGKIIIESPDFAEKEHTLERAYVRLLEGRKTPEELVNDDAFLAEYVYNCPKIKDKIVAEYLATLNTETPKVMAGGGETFVTPPRSPKNLSEAMRLAEKLLSK